MINFNKEGKGVQVLEQFVLTEKRMIDILNSTKFTNKEKQQIKRLQSNIQNLYEQGYTKKRVIPMIDSKSKTYIWLD